ncbi:hypothetical protein CSB11_01550 [Candidatus Campbellbacteria bacterium]|nr:MAG: hypothetical protein CSB11_01550 [Candidatus Campbellbacteria bacterium]
MAFQKNDQKLRETLEKYFRTNEPEELRLFLNGQLDEVQSKKVSLKAFTSFKRIRKYLKGRCVNQTHLSHEEHKKLELAIRVLDKIKKQQQYEKKKVAA